jgi:Ca-activated chloride channel homolog
MMMSNMKKLTWNARTDQRLIGTLGGQRHIVVEVRAPRMEESSRQRPPLNLGLVIDASGSMSGQPLEAAKEAARGVVARLNEGDRLTLVSFADDVIVHADAAVADERGRLDIVQSIDRLETRGCTDLGAGWLAGCQCVAGAMDRQPLTTENSSPTQNRVIVLSDGFANRGIVEPRELGHHASELRSRGLYTSTVGIGDGYSPVQLDAIAEHGGGRSHDAPVGEDIVSVVLGELGEILETAAEDMTITVRPPSGVGIEVFGRYPVSRVGNDFRIALGRLVSGASRQVVMQVSVPSGRVGDTHWVEMRPDWRDLDTGTRCHGESMTVAWVVSEEAVVAAKMPDPEVGELVARMWQNHLRLDSVLLNSEGRLEEAGRVVKEAMPAFRDYCGRVEGTEELLADMREHEEAVTGVMDVQLCMSCVDDTKRSLKSDRDYRVNKRD